MRKLLISCLIAGVAVFYLQSCSARWSERHADGFNVIEQRNGATLGYSPASGLQLLEEDGYVFKDLNANGVLDTYEDWRLPDRRRAENLASLMSVEQIAGLMLYSKHQAVPTDSYGEWSSTYNGVTLEESGLPVSAISDKQKAFLEKDNVRAVLVVRVSSPEDAARWNNNLQSFCEGLGLGIPVNISSDPRHEPKGRAEFNGGAGGRISIWPNPLGIAATFDPAVALEFGRIASREYRALGIATALSPQADLGTEPRWARFDGTFGENVSLATDMVRAYVDGFQTTDGTDDGWGAESVNTMVKHWPGGGTGEGGRDAHYSFGKYSVFPGGELDTQLKPFLEGAFNLEGPTSEASAVMPYYTISYGVDPSGRNVGNGFSGYIIGDMLRGQYGYDGVVCTDWGITHDHLSVEGATGKCWGVEGLTVAERHYEVIKAGVDQFGGNNDMGPVLEAYGMYARDFGEEKARERFERSAVRLLMNMFRTGLFENPYADPSAAGDIVGCDEFVEAGYEAQLKSVVMLKNKSSVIPVAERRKVYFPKRHITSENVFLGTETTDDYWEYPMDTSVVSRYFDIVDDPAAADFAFVYIQNPDSPFGYDAGDRRNGGNGYLPVSLQYEDYEAVDAREVSIAGGDPLESFVNRSYKGKSVRTNNREDMVLVRNVKALMGDKPVITAVNTLRPFVPAEIEPYSDVLLLGMNVQAAAILDIVGGRYEPSGLLPMQMPVSMKTVELQYEDRGGDMEAYSDSEGNVYDFAFGMDWSGRIEDSRTEKY